jgi:hypothetical protein
MELDRRARRLRRVDHGRKRLDLDGDRVDAVLGEIPVARRDDRDRLARVPDGARRERRPPTIRLALGRWNGWQAGEVCCRPGALDARQGASRRHVDTAQDAVGRPGPDERRVEGAVDPDVSDVAARAGDETAILDA